MPLDSFYLEPDATSTTEHLNEKESPDSVSINFNNSKIEISSALNSTDMRLVWQVPFGSLLLDTLQSILLPLLLNIALLATGAIWLYHFSPPPSPFHPSGAKPCGK